MADNGDTNYGFDYRYITKFWVCEFNSCNYTVRVHVHDKYYIVHVSIRYCDFYEFIVSIQWDSTCTLIVNY